MIIDNHFEDSIYASIPNIENAKEFLDVISKKYKKFSKNEKKELSDDHWSMFVLNLMSLMCHLIFGCWIVVLPIKLANSMHAVISKRSPSSLKQYVYIRDNTRVKIDFLEVVRLQLSTRIFLELQDVAYIPSIRRILISLPILNRLGYSFLFGTCKVKLYQDTLFLGTGLLCGSLCKLEQSTLPSIYATLSVNTVSSTKRLRLNEKFSILWKKHLGHISIQRIERIIKNEILPDLDFSYFDTCVDYIKGKLTANIRNAKVDKCTELLRVIHTYICWPSTPPAMGGHKYFIMFIDDYSRYGFIELIREKYDSSKLKLSSNKGRRSKWFILTKVVGIMVDMMRRDATLDHL